MAESGSRGRFPHTGKTTDPGARARIFLVDDEEMVRDVAAEMIGSLGHEVATAQSDEEAFERSNELAGEVDLVILDLVMPQQGGGGRVFDQIRRLKPDIPILLASGNSRDGMVSSLLGEGGCGFIQKPFNLTELSRKLEELLHLSGPVAEESENRGF